MAHLPASLFPSPVMQHSVVPVSAHVNKLLMDAVVERVGASAGHVHSYERTAPVYNYTVNPCGAVHITIGDGGNSEGISFLAKDLHTQRECPPPASCSSSRGAQLELISSLRLSG